MLFNIDLLKSVWHLPAFALACLGDFEQFWRSQESLQKKKKMEKQDLECMSTEHSFLDFVLVDEQGLSHR